jgi:hypothetical protein
MRHAYWILMRFDVPGVPALVLGGSEGCQLVVGVQGVRYVINFA